MLIGSNSLWAKGKWCFKGEDIDMQIQVSLRPRCGFCGKELKKLSQITSDGITLGCCSECGAVLGIVKEK